MYVTSNSECAKLLCHICNEIKLIGLLVYPPSDIRMLCCYVMCKMSNVKNECYGIANNVIYKWNSNWCHDVTDI